MIIVKIMEVNRRKRSIFIVVISSAALVASACAGSTATTGVGTAGISSADTERLAVFAPNPSGRKVRVNYEPLDALLDSIVLRAGPSLRKLAARPRPFTGTRIVYGHFSPFRLEGDKVLFSQLDDARKTQIAEITEDLVAFGNRVKIATLPRSEQLAYWFNLHNMLVISEIAKRYPVIEPRKVKIGPDDLPFHEAPLTSIEGVPLSLQDIRVRIVYRYWDDPRVIYGFFRGDLASPSIRGRAWKAESLSKDLGVNAHEFVNSLRGVRRGRTAVQVSPIYAEARSTLFTDWPDELRMHLRSFAERDVDLILDDIEQVEFSRYEARTADLVGGRPHLPFSQIVGAAYGPGPETPGGTNYRAYYKQFPLATPTFAFMFSEFVEKFAELRRQKKAGKGYIEIIDMPFDDEPSEDALLPETKQKNSPREEQL